MDTRTLTSWFSNEELESPLTRMVGDNARLSGEWTADQFKTGLGDGLGAWRVAGNMNTSHGERQWSMVVKGWACAGKVGSPSAHDWPWREAELYGSGMLNDLPGIFAPTCFGSVERDGSVWVWLEDLTAVPQLPWTLERYTTAALHLGQFNGAYLTGKPMPNHRSLSRRWLAGRTAAATDTMASLDMYMKNPCVQRMLPPDVLAAQLRIWNQRQMILDRFQTMPQTFCHLDAFHQNIFFRVRRGIEELVLIDWSFAGPATLGEELAALCIAGGVFDPRMPANTEEIERVAFRAYIEGLRDAGWKDAEESVWLAYRSAALLRYGPGALGRVLPMIINDSLWSAMANSMGVSPDLAREHLVQHYRWVADHADEI